MMIAPQKFKTLEYAATAEFRDRGSRFLAFAYPVKELDAVKQLVKTLKSEHPKAAHHCVAYRLGTTGDIYRAGDDGEPSGSAGRPMLGAIDSLGLTNVLVVVVRYFGGTLLGVPGLINAYGSVAAAALAEVPVREQWVTTNIAVECSYENLNDVLIVFRRHEGTIIRQDMQLFCVVEAAVPRHLSEACLSQLTDLRGVRPMQP